jgi:hypothetical protein
MLGVVAVAAQMRAQERPRAAEAPEDKGWQAVAPGRVEPWSGEIKIAAAVVGRIGEVLVGVNDKVFAGEVLVRQREFEAVRRVDLSEIFDGGPEQIEKHADALRLFVSAVGGYEQRHGRFADSAWSKANFSPAAECEPGMIANPSRMV